MTPLEKKKHFGWNGRSILAGFPHLIFFRFLHVAVQQGPVRQFEKPARFSALTPSIETRCNCVCRPGPNVAISGYYSL